MILVIDGNRQRGTSICEMFHYMGILSYPVSIRGAFSEINSSYKAILISDLSSLPDSDDYIARLKRYSGKIPIFALSSDSYRDSCTKDVDMVFDNDISSSHLVNEIIRFQDERSLPSLGTYLLAGLDLGCDIPKPRFLSKTLSFTKTETMIVRYLTVSYPDYVSADKLLLHSLKPGKFAEASVIRAHISSINKKFKSQRGRNLIISEPGRGYVIATPEIIERRAEILNK